MTYRQTGLYVSGFTSYKQTELHGLQTDTGLYGLQMDRMDRA